MGYSENAKAYHIYIPENRKIVIRRDVKFMEEKAFRRSLEMAMNTQVEEDPLFQPQQPTKDGSSASPRHKDFEESYFEEEKSGEQENPLTTSGRTSRELQQFLRDAKEFVGVPRDGKKVRRHPDRYQALVAKVREPSNC